MFSTIRKEKMNLVKMFRCVYLCVHVWAHMCSQTCASSHHGRFTDLGALSFIIARVTLYYSLKCSTMIRRMLTAYSH